MGPYTLEQKLKAVEAYEQGLGGLKSIAKQYNVDVSALRIWVKLFQLHGQAGLTKSGRRRFSPEFKLRVIEHMEAEQASSRETAVFFNLPNLNLPAIWQQAYLEGGFDRLKSRKRKKSKPPLKELLEGSSNGPSARSLQEENELLKAENAYLKKLSASILNARPQKNNA